MAEMRFRISAIQRVKKPRRVCRPQTAKKYNHFLSRQLEAISVVCEFERLNEYFTVRRNRSGEMVEFGNINAYKNFHEVVPL